MLRIDFLRDFLSTVFVFVIFKPENLGEWLIMIVVMSLLHFFLRSLWFVIFKESVVRLLLELKDKWKKHKK